MEDYYLVGRRWWLRLHEKGGKHHEMPVHHTLQDYLDSYLEAAAIGSDRKGPLFRTAEGRTGRLTNQAMAQPDVYRMIQRRAEAAGVATKIGCHSWRARGITASLENGGLLEHAQQMAGHASWLGTPARARPSSTTDGASKSRSMRSSGLRSNGPRQTLGSDSRI